MGKQTIKHIRKLGNCQSGIDFCSNDYLSFAKSKKIYNHFLESLQNTTETQIGATGSRLLTGNYTWMEELEKKIALFHHAESALIFNTGYEANLAIFSTLPSKDDTILLDQYVHASIIDGCRLSYGKTLKFKHNDLNDLTKKLKHCRGHIFLGIESIYSMEGDSPDLVKMIDMLKPYSNTIIVDEAHAVGVFGNHGRGWVVAHKLTHAVDLRLVTFGKALGGQGAAILCSRQLRDTLIAKARSFIYTTAPSYPTYLMIDCIYNALIQEEHQNKILNKIKYFTNHLPASLKKYWIFSNSTIHSFLIGNPEKTLEIGKKLAQLGIGVSPILYPTVPLGKERIRVCLHNHNTEREIEKLFTALSKVLV